MRNLVLEYGMVNEVPIAFCRPDAKYANGAAALWLPYLGGDKNTGAQQLQAFAKAGYFALSLDPILHGDRCSAQDADPRSLVFQNFRAVMWDILGTTVLDAFRVLDWAIKTFDLRQDVVAGGMSMGGDIAIALAGIDARIRRVAAIAASPDWMRPGMTDVLDSTKVIDQGTPTPLGAWLYAQLDPITNLDHYRRAPEILFELGEADTHISPSHAARFKEALSQYHPGSAANITIHQSANADHLAMIQDHTVINRSIEFLIQ